MKYKFKCPKCNKEYEIECSMSEYDNIKKEVFCDKCDILLIREFEPFSVEMNVGYNAENHIRSKWQG